MLSEGSAWHSRSPSCLLRFCLSEVPAAGGESAGGSAAEVPPPPAPPAGAGAARPDKKGKKASRQHPFGPWSISEVHDVKGGRGLKAWGANCNMHHDHGDSKPCKKQIEVTSKVSADEARRLVKAWLILGKDISADDKEGRTKHIFGIGGSLKKRVPADWTEAVLDSMV